MQKKKWFTENFCSGRRCEMNKVWPTLQVISILCHFSVMHWLCLVFFAKNMVEKCMCMNISTEVYVYFNGGDVNYQHLSTQSWSYLKLIHNAVKIRLKGNKNILLMNILFCDLNNFFFFFFFQFQWNESKWKEWLFAELK